MMGVFSCVKWTERKLTHELETAQNEFGPHEISLYDSFFFSLELTLHELGGYNYIANIMHPIIVAIHTLTFLV